MKIRITTPATSANLGPGFDFLGIALNLYNVYEFESSENFEFVGFDSIDNNMVYDCFKRICDKPVRITLVECGIPPSHGLGSSASASVAGFMAGNYFSGNKYSLEELSMMIAEYEGHPDNSMACLYGGLVSNVLENGKFKAYKWDVSDELKFNVLIPPYNVKTSEARKILPGALSYKDVTYNASRSFLLLKAFEKGDMDLLKVSMKDMIHEPYRSKLIKEWDELKKLSNEFDSTLNISGSGPTMISISKDNLFTSAIKDFGLKALSLKADSKGAVLEEL